VGKGAFGIPAVWVRVLPFISIESSELMLVRHVIGGIALVLAS
jgi:hypothetical protein